jgi:hypothetical protein
MSDTTGSDNAVLVVLCTGHIIEIWLCPDARRQAEIAWHTLSSRILPVHDFRPTNAASPIRPFDEPRARRRMSPHTVCGGLVIPLSVCEITRNVGTAAESLERISKTSAQRDPHVVEIEEHPTDGKEMVMRSSLCWTLSGVSNCLSSIVYLCRNVCHPSPSRRAACAGTLRNSCTETRIRLVRRTGNPMHRLPERHRLRDSQQRTSRPLDPDGNLIDFFTRPKRR